jgi:glycoside/pentoside/hexuronide:cation symporter, GPH family
VSPVLSQRTTIAYSAAVGPVAILGLPLSVFLPPFVAQGGVIAVGMVGALFFIATIWDGIVDPGIGALIDRVNRGSRPHLRWIWAASAPLLALLTIIALAGDALPFWALLLVLVLFASSLSLMDVAHLAWGSALAGSRGESSRLFGARELAGKIFVLLAFAAPALAEGLVPGLSLQRQVIAYCGLAAAALPLSLWSAGKLPARPILPQPQLDWTAEFRMVRNFRPFKLLLAAQVLNTFGLGAMTSLFIFFVAAVLKLEAQGPVLLLISFVGGVLGTPLWVKIALRLGKPIGMAIMSAWLVAVLLLSLALPAGNFALATVFVFALGSGFAGLIFVYGIAADLVAVHSRDIGGNRAGFFFALANVTQKVGTATGIGVSYAALGILGFDAQEPAQSARIVQLLYIALPIIGWIGVAMLMHKLSRDPAFDQP